MYKDIIYYYMYYNTIIRQLYIVKINLAHDIYK